MSPAPGTMPSCTAAPGDGQVLGMFGRHGRDAGHVRRAHNIAVDSRGNAFTAEADTGRAPGVSARPRGSHAGGGMSTLVVPTGAVATLEADGNLVLELPA